MSGRPRKRGAGKRPAASGDASPAGGSGGGRRPRRSSSSGGNESLVMMGVLGAVVAGVIVLWGPVMRVLKKDDGPKPRSEPEVVVETVTIGSGKEISPERRERLGARDDVASPRRDVPRAGRQDDEARALLKEAEALLKRDRVDEAIKAYAKAGALDVGASVLKEAERGQALARLFARTERENPPDVESTAENLYVFELKNGGGFRAVVEREEPEKIWIVKDMGIRAPLDRKDIASMKPVSGSARSSELRRELAEKKALTKRTGVDYWKLAGFAFRSRLEDEARDLLREAARIDPNLPKTITEYKAHKLLKAAMYYQGVGVASRAERKFSELRRKYPDTKAAGMADELLADARNQDIDMMASNPSSVTVSDGGSSAPKKDAASPDRTPITLATLEHEQAKWNAEEVDKDMDVAPVQVARLSRIESSAGSVVQKADAAFEEGMRLYGKGAIHESVTTGRRMINQANDKFDEAERLYNQALASDPGNSRITKRLEEVRRKKYWAGKFRRLF